MQAEVLFEGANALSYLLGGEGDAVHVAAFHNRDHEADRIIGEVLLHACRILVTPFDRSAIISLIGAMANVIAHFPGAARYVRGG